MTAIESINAKWGRERVRSVVLGMGGNSESVKIFSFLELGI